MLTQLITQLAEGGELTAEQIAAAVAALAREDIPAALKADFLEALSRKGETPDEIAAFVRELRARAVRPALGDLREREILDVVGTGGDRLSTFNISTAAALVAAAAGARVAKHGNRASTSPIGSADVMEALGLPFELGPEEAVTALRRDDFAFFYAPQYHPAFRHIIPARKLCAARGRTTIFNFLGPLLNPANPSAMLIGVAQPGLCEPLARVLQTIGVRRAMVVCGLVPHHGEARYLDELSPLGESTIAEFYQDRALTVSRLDPGLFPVQSMTLADLRGGDREVNANIIRGILSGVERGPKRDAVLLNSAAALFVAGQTRSLLEGWERAAEVIDSGRAWRKLEALRRSAEE